MTVGGLVYDGGSRRASGQKRSQGEKRDVGTRRISLQEVVGLGSNTKMEDSQTGGKDLTGRWRPW